jgi:hypothetical protein
MNSSRKLLIFILINILVSAVTTLVILSIWDAVRKDSLPARSSQAGTGSLPGTSSATLPPLDQTVLQVENVFGAGDPERETVRLRRVGEGDLWLTGWQLRDEDGNIYSFPALMLNRDGAIEIYTRTGSDTAIQLFWGLDQSVWQNGEVVSIYDPAENLRASYKIP